LGDISVCNVPFYLANRLSEAMHAL